MIMWLKDKLRKKNKYKLRPLSKEERKKIVDYAVTRTSKLMRETKGMSTEEIKKYKKENGYAEISEEDSKKYREIFQKAFEKAIKGDIDKDNSLKVLFKRAFLKSKYN